MKKNKPNLKTYQGKDRITQAVPGAPGISRLYIWDETKKEYSAPLTGKSYNARRYSFQGGDKKREFLYFSSLEEARSWQRNVTTRRQGEYSDLSLVRKSPLVHEVVTKWQNEAWPLMRENTKIQYGKCIKFFDPIMPLEIETVRPSTIDELISHWKKTSLKRKSIRSSFGKEFETLTILFRWYQKNYDDAALVLPFKTRHTKQIIVRNATKTARKHMTEEEADRFMLELRNEGPMFFALGFTQMKQMMRISEVAGMKWSNLDTKNAFYNLCEHAVWPRIEGKEAYLELGTKNIKSGETYQINLFQEVIRTLQGLCRHPGCDLIFHDNGKLLTYRQIQYRFDKAFMAAGLPYRATHVLRHTGSTSFYNATGDLLALQQMGTWSDIRMPQHYAKIMSSRARDAIKKLEAKPFLKLVKSEEN